MNHLFRSACAVVFVAGLMMAQTDNTRQSTTLFSATPLMDLGTGAYKGFQGGLFASGLQTVPSADATAGSRFANEIQPLDPSGLPSASGKIVFVSVGMSNAMEEFQTFIQAAHASTQVNHSTLAIVNGAQSSMTACYWTVAFGTPPCPHATVNQFDRVLNTVLTPAGLTEHQVQVVWIKEANPDPAITGCGADQFQPCEPLCNPHTTGCVNTPEAMEALRYEQQLGEILRAAKIRWPNLKLAFLASRIYAGYATVAENPEPYAYEYGFSVKWLIQAQINQMQTTTVDSVAGDLDYNSGTAPWVTWGPYLWANGPVPRSDGLAWCNGQTTAPCKGEMDFQSDGTHPNDDGAGKVSNLLMNFFLRSAFASKWFPASAGEQ